jgi:hypothetical protein
MNLGNQFTIASWVYIPSSATNIQTIIANSTSIASNSGFRLCVNTYGTRDGKIIASNDDGASWEQWMDFGGMIEVINLRNHAGQLDATLRLGEYEFYVRTENGRIWKT